MSLKTDHANRLTTLELRQQADRDNAASQSRYTRSLDDDLGKLKSRVDALEAAAKPKSAAGGYTGVSALAALNSTTNAKPTPTAAQQVREALELAIRHAGLDESYTIEGTHALDTDRFLDDLRLAKAEDDRQQAHNDALERLYPCTCDHDFDEAPDNVTSIFKGGDSA